LDQSIGIDETNTFQFIYSSIKLDQSIGIDETKGQSIGIDENIAFQLKFFI